MWSFEQVAGTAEVDFMEPRPFFESHFGGEVTRRLLALDMGKPVVEAAPEVEAPPLPPEPEVVSHSLSIEELSDRIRQWLERGQAARSSGLLEIARHSFASALLVDSSLAIPLRALGELCHDDEDFIRAERLLLKAVALGGGEADSYFRLAEMAARGNRSIEARRYVELCVEVADDGDEVVQKAQSLSID
jgi:tetratricopeptide (TPR) repeat protein